jgi:hypothetical protein
MITSPNKFEENYPTSNNLRYIIYFIFNYMYSFDSKARVNVHNMAVIY